MNDNATTPTPPQEAFRLMQSELPIIPRTRAGYNFKYAPYEKIGELAFPIIWKHGFSICHCVTRDSGVPVVRTIITHTESGATWSSDYEFDPKVRDQERGKSLTYGKRYNTVLLLGLMIEGEPDRDDDDGSARASENSHDNEF